MQVQAQISSTAQAQPFSFCHTRSAWFLFTRIIFFFFLPAASHKPTSSFLLYISMAPSHSRVQSLHQQPVSCPSVVCERRLSKQCMQLTHVPGRRPDLPYLPIFMHNTSSQLPVPSPCSARCSNCNTPSLHMPRTYCSNQLTC